MSYRHTHQQPDVGMTWWQVPSYARLAHPEVDAVVERAAEYARTTVPDALAHFKIDGAGLRDRVAARLATRMPATAHAAG